jgi:hypothetical protein
MMERKEIEKIWNTRVFEDICDFFDPGFIERAWVNAIGPDESTYEEAMCMLFDDDSFDDYIDQILPKYTNDGELILEFDKLRNLLHDFNPPDDMPDEEKIAQPEWKAIMAQAAKVLELSRNSPLAEYMPDK